MLQTALIAEDHQNSNHWVQQTLKELGFEVIKHAYYCDDALLALKWAIQHDHPFELLVTDLSFIEDNREQQLKNGTELIMAARALQPELKILVFPPNSSPPL